MWSDAIEIDQSTAQLSRQASIFSLTFDEFQSTMGIGNDGKDFGSMNMEEFLKNLWTAEESQAMEGTVAAPDCGGGALQRQGSLTLPRTLSIKTVADVWQDLICDSAQSADGSDVQEKHRQPKLGEMTLEEFLVRAGVVREEIKPTALRPVVNTDSNTDSTVYYGDMSASGNGNCGFTFTFPQAEQTKGSVIPKSLPGNSGVNLTMLPGGVIGPFAAQLPLGANVDMVNKQGMGAGIVGRVDPVTTIAKLPGMGAGVLGRANPVTTIASVPGLVGFGVGAVASPPVNQISYEVSSNGDVSSLSPVPFSFGGELRVRKGASAVEKVLERRQRRMIKNRESAARSRARKQAYTVELEAEIAKLKEKNEELRRKQMEILKFQKIQVYPNVNTSLVWYFDNGCFQHMVGTRSILMNYVPMEKGPKVIFDGFDRGNTRGYGIQEKVHQLNDCKRASTSTRKRRIYSLNKSRA